MYLTINIVNGILTFLGKQKSHQQRENNFSNPTNFLCSKLIIEFQLLLQKFTNLCEYFLIESLTFDFFYLQDLTLKINYRSMKKLLEFKLIKVSLSKYFVTFAKRGK